jgi:hypothetical protein
VATRLFQCCSTSTFFQVRSSGQEKETQETLQAGQNEGEKEEEKGQEIKEGKAACCWSCRCGLEL